MKTYWLTGEDASRRQQRVQRGIARLERAGSVRKRGKPEKPTTPTYGFRNEGSPQMQHQGLPTNLNTTSYNYSMDSPASFRQNNYLHPYAMLVGPTSQDLIRRSSSRRRRLKFAIGSDDADKDTSLSGDEKDLEPLEFTADSLPTIIRSKIDQESSSEGEHSRNKNDFSDSVSVSIASGRDGTFTGELSYEDCSSVVPGNSTPVETSSSPLSTRSTTSARRAKAPIVRIESFDFGHQSDSPIHITENRETESHGSNSPNGESVPALQEDGPDLLETRNTTYQNSSPLTNTTADSKDLEQDDSHRPNTIIRPVTLNENNKTIRAINGLASNLPNSGISGNRVSPFFDRPNPFCSDSAEDDQCDLAPCNSEFFPFMDSINYEPWCHLEIDSLPQRKQRMESFRQSKNSKGVISCEASEKVRQEMVPLLSNRLGTVTCAHAGHCEEDEHV